MSLGACLRVPAGGVGVGGGVSGLTAIRCQPCRAGRALSVIRALIRPGLTRRRVTFFAHGRMWGLAFGGPVRWSCKASGNRTLDVAGLSFRQIFRWLFRHVTLRMLLPIERLRSLLGQTAGEFLLGIARGLLDCLSLQCCLSLAGASGSAAQMLCGEISRSGRLASSTQKIWSGLLERLDASGILPVWCRFKSCKACCAARSFSRAASCSRAACWTA